MKSWKYYNYAMIPTTAPHEPVDASPVADKSIWKENKRAILARWTSDFDCGEETEWWYIIKEPPFGEDTLSAKSRRHVRQALKKAEAKIISPSEYAEALTVVHNNACRGYKNFAGDWARASSFVDSETTDYWGIFALETNELIGYMTCRRYDEYVETVTAKYDPQFLKLRGSDAVHYAVLNYYLNEKNYRYVCSGARSVNHETNAQEYKISTFGFKKTYCRLNLEYNPKFKPLFRLLYPMRGLLAKLDKFGKIHQLNAVLAMEEICRRQKRGARR